MKQKRKAQDQPQLPDPQSLQPTEDNMARSYIRRGEWIAAGSHLSLAGHMDDAVVCFAMHHAATMDAAAKAKSGREEVEHTAELTQRGVLDYIRQHGGGRAQELQDAYRRLVADRPALEESAAQVRQRRG